MIEVTVFHVSLSSSEEEAFRTWVLSAGASERERIILEKTLFSHPFPEGEITYAQMSLPDKRFALLLNQETKETPFATTDSYYRYEKEGEVWVDFANPVHFGGGWREVCNVQEERLFLEFPTLAHLAYATRKKGIRPATAPPPHADPTPFFVPKCKRLFDLSSLPYGSALYSVPAKEIEALIHPAEPQTLSHIVGMAAQSWSGSGNKYDKKDLLYHLKAAYLAFAGARKVLGREVTIHTGAWGAGVFANSVKTLTLLQLLAARLSGVSIVFEGTNSPSHPTYTPTFVEQANTLLNGKTPETLLTNILEWQQSDPTWAPRDT